MKILFTKEKYWLDKWDEFVIANSDGSHLVLSDWLKSYQSYGFDFEVGLYIENEEIIGGYGAVIPKLSFFKFYIIPYVPLLLNENNLVLPQIIEAAINRSNFLKTSCLQIASPSLLKFEKDIYYSKYLKKHSFKKGNRFKYVFSFTGLNWLDLKKYNTIDDLLLDFKSSVRRDIRSAERKGVTISYAVTYNEIERAYKICLENAQKANYGLRDWNDIKETIVDLIEKGIAKFIVGTKDNEVKGAIFIIKAGGYYTYILGGTKKEKPDLLVGHLLQWEAIKLSFLEKNKGYNLSLGGSKGVQDFKNGFNTKQILAEDSAYYLINNSLLFSIYVFFEKYMKPHKRAMAKILASIKRLKNESRK
ncbi:GNAT family N-acetyltransferase [Flavobacterium sp.]|uniref:GNAT family N-acetyltransferase n=1 Tax=Flavobacterium sp. TaxID=239 RepID=UPI0025C4F434|nr:GNAT family N-acetyltransferase [Flavobacterium sp.]